MLSFFCDCKWEHQDHDSQIGFNNNNNKLAIIYNEQLQI